MGRFNVARLLWLIAVLVAAVYVVLMLEID
jgi:hypothetical protein